MIKVNVHILQAVMRARHQNLLRYHLAMLLTDKNRSGKVTLADYIPTVAEKFQVKEKTVVNNLYRLQGAGYGSMTETHFYYRSLNKLPYDYGTLSTLAVWVGWDNLLTIQDMRAFCYQTALIHKSGEKTIARETLQQITGHTNKTQLKYESRGGVKKQANYASLGRYSRVKYEAALYTESSKNFGSPVFIGNSPDDKHSYIMRQIPNTYWGNLKIGKRRCSKPDRSCTLTWGNGYSRRYYQNCEKVDSEQRSYLQHIKHTNLWLAYEKGVPKC